MDGKLKSIHGPRIRFRHYAKSYIHIHVTGCRHPCQYDGASWSILL